MCVAYPGTVIEIKDKNAVVDFSGNKVNARAGLTDISVGDKVLVHAGCILQVVSDEEADEITSVMKELGEAL